MRTFFNRGSRRALLARLRLPILLAATFVLGSAWPALAQFAATPAGQLVVRSDGFVFWVQDGQKHTVYPAPLSDDQINSLPEGVSLNASLQASSSANAVLQPPAMPGGTSRADRLPLGQACTCTIVRPNGAQQVINVAVTQVQRESWPLLRTASPLNQPPRDGFEYVTVTLHIVYNAGPRDLPVSLDRFDFSALDRNDVQYGPAFVTEPDSLTATSAFPGTDLTRSVTFQIPRGDPNIVLVWHYSDDRPVWFALSLA
jgi:hypothetical protein